jgi:16S rRNA (guanine(966)-N(2))-methyltransferase RsmD
VRIISGSAKGHRLQTFKGLTVRPTSDRVRESIFNMIGSSIAGAKILDLFAGFGAMGLEALSRGAEFVTFVEKSKRAADVIKTNLGRLGFQNGQVIPADVYRFFRTAKKKEERYDIIFSDPPYKIFHEVWIGDLWLGVAELLEDQGIFIVEHPSKWSPPAVMLNLQLNDSRKYGQTSVSFYAKL